jgi:hypothetical protein
MWVAGIMQGLMWREYDDQGFLVYSFAETVAAIHPEYVMRTIGGLCTCSVADHGLERLHDHPWDVREEAPTGQRTCPCSRQNKEGPDNVTNEKHGRSSATRPASGRLPRGGHIGGIVEIAPLFYLENTIEKVEGMRPYSPLELAGRNIYIREGCYVCHSQMIRPFRDEVERYGHYSLAAESMYDHPFQWGSKRTGPDLARVGGRYSDEWHVEHLIDPRSVVPESIMPSYAFLATTRSSKVAIIRPISTPSPGGCALHRRDDRERRRRTWWRRPIPDGDGGML